MRKIDDDSINVKIFYALKVAEKSQVPLLIMSNPGMGKTTTIYMYGKLRNMDVVCLQGNSVSDAEAIHGYETVSTAPVKAGEVVVSSKTRPSWMNRILDNQKNGRKTLLFLDEITTANECVQSALLKLIFDRTCGVEKLPPVEECLIVSAGNYSNNLTATMTIIPPLMNRFMIYNITPTANNLSDFLNKYTGAISGMRVDPLKNVEEMLQELDKQELNVDEEMKYKIGEYFEKGILSVTEMLINKSKKVDLSITDLRNIYGDVDDGDPNLYGFITPRSLCYLTEVAIACYSCFGKNGIQSKNFRQMIDGLAGIGLTKEMKGSSINIKSNKVGGDYHTTLSHIAIELEKLSSTILPEYVNYFSELVKSTNKRTTDKGVFTVPEMQALKNKIKEMGSDSRLARITKPLEDDLLVSIYSVLDSTLTVIPSSGKYSVPDINSGKTVAETLEENGITIEKVAGYVNVFNVIAETFNSIREFVHTESWGYPEAALEKVEALGVTISKSAVSVKMMSRAIQSAYPGSLSLLPKIKVIDAH